MKISGIIPARYDSSRLPGKPLMLISGKPMIQRVYEQVIKAKKVHEVVVATDDLRIYDCVLAFGGKVEMTSNKHRNGTERIAEVAAKSKSDAFINIQGDEPFIAPEQIDAIADLLEAGAEIATLTRRLKDPKAISDPNTVKMVRDISGKALYFSRYPIPFNRNENAATVYWQHIGIYGFAKNILEELVKLPASILEQTESLEQLRWLENGYSIHTTETELENISIDTAADLIQVEQLFKK